MDYPKDVYSPVGGWYSNARHWKRNFFFVAIGAISWISFQVYTSLEKSKHDKLRYSEKIPLIRFAHLYDEENKRYDILRFHHQAERMELAKKKENETKNLTEKHDQH